jgi:peptide/nickel transport system substrate-binding protein
MKKSVLAITGAALTVSVAGILATFGGTSLAASGRPNATKHSSGGVIVWAMPPQTDINWYLPITDAEYDSVANGQLYEELEKPLIWINNSYGIDWKTSVAQKITYNRAGTVYHVFLNPKWRWSDGQPVTAQDLLFSWNVIKAASATTAPTPWPYVGAGTGDIPSGVKSVVENNNYEVTFTLDKPANQQWFIYNGLAQITPLPAQTLDVDGSDWSAEIKYLGSQGENPSVDRVVDGPFKLKKAVNDQEWVLVPNPDYAGHKSTVSEIVYEYEGSDESEFAALRSGTVQVGYLMPDELRSAPELTAQGDKFFKAYPFGTYYLYLNMRPGSKTAPIFDQLYVRQAMEYGIDKAAIDNKINAGLAAPLYGPIPSQPRTKFYDPAVQGLYSFNIKKGEKLLEDHGWKKVKGVMTKGGKMLKFTLDYVTGTEEEQQTAEVIQSDWAQEGIQVTLKPMLFSNFIGETANPADKNDWAIGLGSGWAYSGPGYYPSGGVLFETGASSGFGYSNVTEDRLIAGTHTPYPTEQQTLKQFFQYEVYTAKQLPMLWLNSVATDVVTLPTVHNVEPYYGAATYIPQLQYWTISSKS